MITFLVVYNTCTNINVNMNTNTLHYTDPRQPHVISTWQAAGEEVGAPLKHHFASPQIFFDSPDLEASLVGSVGKERPSTPPTKSKVSNPKPHRPNFKGNVSYLSSQGYVYVNVHIHIYIYIYLHVCIYIYIRTHVHMLMEGLCTQIRMLYKDDSNEMCFSNHKQFP